MIPLDASTQISSNGTNGDNSNHDQHHGHPPRTHRHNDGHTTANTRRPRRPQLCSFRRYLVLIGTAGLVIPLYNVSLVVQRPILGNTDIEGWLPMPTTTNVTTHGTSGSISSDKHKRYHEMPDDEFQVLQKNIEKNPILATSFSDADVVLRSQQWFPSDPNHKYDNNKRNKAHCSSTCCATPVAVSMAHEDKRIITTIDGLDLADVVLQHYESDHFFEFFAPTLTPELLPCLKPGVIIHLDNYKKICQYFFQVLRPNITVPYVIISSESDANSPYWTCKKYITNDKLLLKWYGQSLESKGDEEYYNKLVPFPLGLSKIHDQAKYLTKYLELRNYTNPFKGKEQKKHWTDWAKKLDDRENTGEIIDAVAEVKAAFFVKFSVNEYSHKMRQEMLNILCATNNTQIIQKDRVSCQTIKVEPHEIYEAASTYLFAASPPGAGWDCYRTWEMILLGVIPFVVGRKAQGGTHGLFDGLPVIEADNLGSLVPSDYLRIMRDYATSPAFLENDFDDGWERLFLSYWRRRILLDVGRADDLVVDDKGRPHYKTWRYGPPNPQRVYCGKAENCPFIGD